MRFAAAQTIVVHLRPFARAANFAVANASRRARPPPRRPHERLRENSFSSAPALAPAEHPSSSLKARRKAWRESPSGVLRHQLDQCSKSGDAAEALRLFSSAASAGVPLSAHHYNALLCLCSSAAADVAESKDFVSRGFEILRHMEAHNVEPNEATFTSVARLATLNGDPELAFSLVKKMAKSGIPTRLRSYRPALFGFCKAGNVDRAKEVEMHMDASGVVLEEEEIAALLDANVKEGKGEEVYRLMHRLRTSVRQVSEETAMVLERWFGSDAAASFGVEDWDVNKVREGAVNGGGGWHGQGWLGQGKWSFGRSEMEGNGTCKRCGEQLVCIDIEASETEGFATSLSTLASQKERKSDFVGFKDWLDRNGPFDVIIDAANMGLYRQKNFSFMQLASVVKGIQKISPSKRPPLIILHAGRLKGWPADLPRNQQLIESWRRSKALYATPPGSNDDWYWLYAAVHCHALLVTNDEMRDHLFQLLGTNFFPRWKEKHQVRISFSHQGPDFYPPPPYSIVIQESGEGNWHVPTVTGDDIEGPRQWICAVRKSSNKPLMA